MPSRLSASRRPTGSRCAGSTHSPSDIWDLSRDSRGGHRRRGSHWNPSCSGSGKPVPARSRCRRRREACIGSRNTVWIETHEPLGGCGDRYQGRRSRGLHHEQVLSADRNRRIGIRKACALRKTDGQKHHRGCPDCGRCTNRPPRSKGRLQPPIPSCHSPGATTLQRP